MQIDAFKPRTAGTLTLSATAASQQVTIAGGGNIEVNNPATTGVIYLEQDGQGNNPTANTTTSYPVYPGQRKIIRMQDGATLLAYIGSIAGPTVFTISIGEGT